MEIPDRVTTYFIRGLWFVVTATLVAAVFLYLTTVNAYNHWRLLPTIAVSAGVLIAISTYARDRKGQQAERERNKSMILLASATKAFDTVIYLLNGPSPTNSRVTWVEAARTLREAVDLREQILDPDYRQAYDLEVQRTRSTLYEYLSVESKETGQRLPLPPQFFFGIKDWEDKTKTLDQAAVEASSEIEVYTLDIHHLPPQPYLGILEPRSIIAIYDFLDFPQDYKDPLDSVRKWDNDWASSHGPDQGARRYVSYMEDHLLMNGKLYERKEKNGKYRWIEVTSQSGPNDTEEN